nr:MAG TPA: hypothetical protein [Caudoviricetes sp.]DAS58909.1 MAG TPA: hypothetical protein [Caudoviricetes sp.]
MFGFLKKTNEKHFLLYYIEAFYRAEFSAGFAEKI